jgi:hypothetical protein
MATSGATEGPAMAKTRRGRSYMTERAARELVGPYTLWRAQMLSEPRHES